MTDTERLARIRRLLGIMLAPAPFGEGPIRLEDWGSGWTQPQREAYQGLKTEAESHATPAIVVGGLLT